MPHSSIRVARPTRELNRIRSFYERLVGLPVLWSFVDHDGFDGVIFGVPDERAQLELVRSPHDDAPSPTREDALVLYGTGGTAAADIVGRLERAATPEITLLEAQVLVADWRTEYDAYHLHSALGMLTPAEFADRWRPTSPPPALIAGGPINGVRSSPLSRASE